MSDETTRGMLTLSPEATQIVTPGDATGVIADAAALLQQSLRKACGVTTGFAIVAEADAREDADNVLLALGRTRWAPDAAVAELWQDGFVIHRQGRVVAIRGGKERGTYHGVLEFLSRFAGVRFYMPGDLWTSLPPMRCVQIPAEVAIRSEPFVKGTSISGLDWPDGIGEWVRRNAAYTREGLAGTHQHNMNALFPPERFAARYPELYPLIDGRRYVPTEARDQKWNPCFTSPQTLAAAEEAVLRYFERHPDHLWVSLALQDSHAHCECPGCREVFAALEQECAATLAAGNPQGITSTYTGSPQGSPDDYGRGQPTEKWGRPYALSQLQWRLLNQLAERLEDRLPGKWLEALAYGITSFAPTFPLHRNVMLFAQIHVSDDVRGLMTPRPDGSLPLDRFVDASIPFGNHDWYEGMYYLVPRIYSGYYTKFLRHLKAKGKTMTFQHAEGYPNWGLDGLKYWVLARTWWDPDQDPEALWRQGCEDLFGAGADAMLRYFQTAEQWHHEQSAPHGPKWKMRGYAAIFQRGAANLPAVTACRAALDEAAQLAATPEERARVDLFSRTFRVTEYLVALGAGDDAPEQVAEFRRYFEETILPDPMTLGDWIRRDPAFLDGVIAAVVPAEGRG